jgi:hypothetical protein
MVQVEDELFRVPKDDLAKNSEVFADMFVMPSGVDHKVEGHDDDHPIFLEGYKKKDFICLLRVMYSRYVACCTALVAENHCGDVAIDRCPREWRR